MSATPEFEQSMRDLNPFGRFASTDEPASLVAYLAGDDAAFITGAVMVMDGGWTAQ